MKAIFVFIGLVVAFSLAKMAGIFDVVEVADRAGDWMFSLEGGMALLAGGGLSLMLWGGIALFSPDEDKREFSVVIVLPVLLLIFMAGGIIASTHL